MKADSKQSLAWILFVPFLALALSYVARGVSFFAFAWVMSTRGETAADLALAVVLMAMVDVFLSRPIGWLSDRFSLSGITAAVEPLRAIVVPAALILSASFVEAMWLFYIVFLALEKLARISLTKIVIRNVLVGNRSRVNGIISAVQDVFLLSGVLLGGVAVGYGMYFLTAMAAGVFVLAATAVAYLLSSGVLLVNLPMQEPFRKTKEEAKTSPTASITGVTGILSATLIIYEMLNVVLPFFVFRVLSFVPASYSLIEAGWNLGAVVAGVLISRWSKVAALYPVWYMSLLILSALIIFQSSLIAISVLMFSSGFLYTFIFVQIETHIQNNYRVEEIGSVKGRIWFWVGIVNIVTFTSVVFMAKWSNIYFICLFCGIISFTAFAFGVILRRH